MIAMGPDDAKMSPTNATSCIVGLLTFYDKFIFNDPIRFLLGKRASSSPPPTPRCSDGGCGVSGSCLLIPESTAGNVPSVMTVVDIKRSLDTGIMDHVVSEIRQRTGAEILFWPSDTEIALVACGTRASRVAEAVLLAGRAWRIMEEHFDEERRREEARQANFFHRTTDRMGQVIRRLKSRPSLLLRRQQ